jgi:hypothetical protein
MVPNAAGVFGANNNGGVGVAGLSDHGDGMRATSASSARSGIFAANNATSNAPAGTPGGNAVFGLSMVPNASGVFGANNNGGTGVSGVSEKGVGLYGHGGTWAGLFDGNVSIKNTLSVDVDIVLANAADCAEEFDLAAHVQGEPGTVMVLDENGELAPGCKAYDRKVAGVISGAGEYKPGLILDRRGSPENRSPLALVGKVYCKVDASYGAIEVGDLLTTSETAGHAMKALDQGKAFGATIGKALRPLAEGQGLIPILIALQ